jgi:hypothetical protein
MVGYYRLTKPNKLTEQITGNRNWDKMGQGFPAVVARAEGNKMRKRERDRREPR